MKTFQPIHSKNFFTGVVLWPSRILSPNFQTFKDPRNRFHGIDSCEESILLWNLFLEAAIPCEGIEDFRIIIVIYCVWEKEPLLVNKFPTRKQYGSCRQGLKSRFLLWKLNFLGYVRLDFILGSYSIPGDDFSPTSRPKIPLLMIKYKLRSELRLRVTFSIKTLQIFPIFFFSVSRVWGLCWNFRTIYGGLKKIETE
jgi:hypothetical protein